MSNTISISLIMSYSRYVQFFFSVADIVHDHLINFLMEFVPVVT